MAAILGRSSISINILRNSQKTAHNMRTFDSPSCGVCTISERSVGVLELMQDGVETLTFDSPPALRRVCQELLRATPTRNGIAQAGWARVRNDTYEVRASQILSDCGIPSRVLRDC
jgi:spore maturation protein CgeB